MQGRKPKIPSIYIDGKEWTARMVKYFRGYSDQQFRRLTETYTIKQLLYGDDIKGEASRRLFIDRSPKFIVGGREFTIAMVYYYMISRKYIDPEFLRYPSFAGACRSYKARYFLPSIWEGVRMVCENKGVNIDSSLKSLTPKQYTNMMAEYRAYITKSKRGRYYWDDNFNPNDRYVECLSVEPRLLKEYVDEMGKDYWRVVEREKMCKQELKRLATTVVELKAEIEKLQKELFRVRVGENDNGNAKEKAPSYL